MKTGTSRLMDSHLVDFSNKNANNIKSGSTTSSQTEISDEEIDKKAKEFFPMNDSDVEMTKKSMWKLGAKWYREQLKLKQ